MTAYSLAILNKYKKITPKDIQESVTNFLTQPLKHQTILYFFQKYDFHTIKSGDPLTFFPNSESLIN